MKRLTIGPCVSGVVATIVFANAMTARSDQAEVDARAKEFWKNIRSAHADDPEGYKTEARLYWEDIARRCELAFMELKHEPDMRPVLKYYVDQFGRHGPQADFRWAAAHHTIMLSACGRFPVYSNFYKHYPVPPKVAFLSEAEELVCELIVRRCMKEPDFQRRYHHILLWDQGILGCDREDRISSQDQTLSLLAQALKEDFSERTRNHYWWYARNVVILAYATGRDDLLRDSEPEGLAETSVRLTKWLYENYPYLRVDRREKRWKLDEDAKAKGEKWKGKTEMPLIPSPKAPSPDWKSPPPPSSRVF